MYVKIDLVNHDAAQRYLSIVDSWKNKQKCVTLKNKNN